MSISPPTDIILDVARAADPVRYQEAAERLTRIAARAPATGFDDALKAAGPSRLAADSTASGRPIGATRPAIALSPSPKKPVEKSTKAYEGFEAVALTSFVQEMLPHQASSVFGSGTAGEIWKSMMAEKIAGEMARAGGIGIAKHLQAAHPSPQSAKPANGISQVGDVTDKAFAKLGIVSANQRSFIERVTPAGAVDGKRKA
jgi:hypothetical protein